MIISKNDLKNYIEADFQAMGLHHGSSWKEYLKGNIYDVMRARCILMLRKYEYITNNYQKHKNNPIWVLRYLFWKNKYQKHCLKNNIFLDPNVFAPGLNIVHPGYIWISQTSSIGRNCTILPRVLLGKKHPGIKPPCIFIGDNCYIGTGVTIMGPIKIGNNVTIAAGAVVVKDVPDNAIVGGNPAKIIRIKETAS